MERPPAAAAKTITPPQPAPAEKKSGPARAPRPAASLPPPDGTPPAERAAQLLASPTAELGAAQRARMMAGMQQTVGNIRAGELIGTAQVKSAIAAEPLSPSIPAPVPVSGAVPATIAKKETQTPSALNVSAPGSKAAAPGPTRAPGTPSPASKPAARTTTEGPRKAAAAGDAKAAAGGPVGKAGGPAAGAPNPRAAIAPAIMAVRHRAAGARKHSAPGVPVASAQAAARTPRVEQQRNAAKQTVEKLDEAKAEKVKRDEFKANLKRAIEAATPKPTTESGAKDVMEHGAERASGKLRDQLATERDAAAGPMKSEAETEVPASSQPEPPAATLQPEPVGPPPAPVSAAPVVPAPLPPERLDYSADRGPTDQVMAENNVTTEQMQESNDPAFGPTMTARSSAEKHEAAAEANYRQGESKVQDQAHGIAAQALSKDLTAIHGFRASQIGKVVSQQQGTQAKNAQERQRITDQITAIKNKTRKDVEDILAPMETEAVNIFDAGLKRAEQAYEDTFKEAKGGVGTWLTTWGSDWDELIANSLAKARVEYLRQVEQAIDEVATLVDGKLDAAKQRVAGGRKEVVDFVKGLDDSVRQFGEEALQAVSADFDAMGSEIDQRRDGLIDKLTEQYKNSYQRMSAMEEKLREENKSLWQRVYDATVGLIKKIIEFKNMLVSVLAKAASVIGDIIAHPIRFLGNLVDAVKLGIRNFVSNIGTHLKQGLIEWLFGALAEGGITLPDKFDLKGILSLILQVLGLTYANIRARAVKIFGEKVVKALETTAEIFITLIKEGPAGLWKWIKDKFEQLKEGALEQIKSLVITKVITAGVTWLVSLLNPASAFFKACKAIYDIIMFFVEHGSQIVALVNAILDSVAAIAQGNIGAAAKWVENALAKTIPVIIGFLASLLGVDISSGVKAILKSIQEPIGAAVDAVLTLIGKGVKAIGSMLGFGKKEEKEKAADGNPDAVDVSFSMYGATHTLTIVGGPAAEVDMASPKGTLLSEKIEGAVGELEKKSDDDQAQKRINFLKPVLSNAKSVEALLRKDDPTKKDKERMRALGSEIAAKLTEYGTLFQASDIQALLDDGSIYVDQAKMELKPEFQGKVIRDKFYKKKFRKKPREAVLKAAETSNPGRYQCQNTGPKGPNHTDIITAADLTIEHTTSVVEHWNAEGNHEIQSERNSWYDDENHLVVFCRSCNLSDQEGDPPERYSPKVTPRFRGPKDRPLPP